MRTGKFWRIVEQARRQAGSDPALVAIQMHADLATLSPTEIVSFDEIWEDTFRALHTYDLWGAAYVIGGGCGDDLFDYFKGYLISCGKSIVKAAKRDPDSLADVMAEGSYIEEWELLMYPAWTAYRTVTGDDIPLNPRKYTHPTGRVVQEADHRDRYPKLWNIFEESPKQREERVADNARIQATLETHGDQLDIPRSVEHVALFPNMRLAHRAAYVLRQRGFTTDEPSGHDGDVVLAFRRHDRLDGEHPNKFTNEIIWHLPHYNGRYDGWGSNITAGAAESTEP